MPILFVGCPEYFTGPNKRLYFYAVNESAWERFFYLTSPALRLLHRSLWDPLYDLAKWSNMHTRIRYLRGSVLKPREVCEQWEAHREEIIENLVVFPAPLRPTRPTDSPESAFYVKQLILSSFVILIFLSYCLRWYIHFETGKWPAFFPGRKL